MICRLNRRQCLQRLSGAAAFLGIPAVHAIPEPSESLFDAHVHIMSPDRHRYPVVVGFERQPSDVASISPSAEALLDVMTRMRIVRAALVQHDPVYGDDNRYIADSARAHPDRFVAVARLNAMTTGVGERMQYWLDRGIASFRVYGGGPPTADAQTVMQSIEGPTPMRMWTLAAQRDLPIVLFLTAQSRGYCLQALRRVMRRLPRLRVILDHLADYDRNELAPAAVPYEMLRAACMPNLFLKVTTHNLRRLSIRTGSARPALVQLVRAYGAQRLLWGSDTGNTRLAYESMVAMARDAVGDLSAADRSSVLRRTAETLYGA